MGNHPQTTASPYFKMVLIFVFVLALICIGICLWVSEKSSPTLLQKDLFTTCSTTWKILIGGIGGLIGGKTL